MLKPFDGVVPYRLEMQAKASEKGELYKFWGDRLYREVVCGEERAQEGGRKRGKRKFYSQSGLQGVFEVRGKISDLPEDTFLTVVFGGLADGKVKQKGTLAKMARGEMVRYLAENAVENPEEIRGFDRLGYRFDEGLSTETEYIFLKQEV